ncbi:unnamed protein product [Brassicogethes aeneus]|uniref:Uncharacterized protein n=1 Tax=Brassicogethes aeneus TaxID=1431903 RepID=A0A9P0FGD7_BRAAE|nr:unnamed protein product [Brassicogethes aeneus]
MAFKFVIFAAALAYTNAGFLSAPAVATYSATPAVHYSAAPAVSSSYIRQASAAPVLSTYAAAAPVVSTYATAPVAIAHAAPVAFHAPAFGSSQQNVIRSFGGAQAISTYSKAVDTPFSSVRKYDTRITNDALSVAHAPLVSTYTATHAAPIDTYSHASPVVAKAALAYSPAVAVSHMTFSGLGASYAY